jgi:hypothetical protein
MAELPLAVALRNPVFSRIAGKAIFVLALTVLLSGFITDVSLTLSFENGRLSVPPLYDDVVYFVEAARWLSAAATRSIGADLYALLDQHAPFATLVAVIGLAFMPGGYVGPYVVNAAVIAAFLAGIAYLIRHRLVVEIAVCLVAVACVPMLSQTIAEARPDLPWGLAVGLAVGGIAYQPLACRDRWSIFFLGALCGLAVDIKPSAILASVACVVSAAAAKLVCEYFESETRNSFLRTRFGLTALIFIAGLITSTVPIVSVELPNTVRYIYSALVTNRDFWETNESLYAHLIHYSIGSSGELALGYWFWIGVVLFSIRIGLALYARRKDLSAGLTLLAIVLVAYAIPTASVMKSYYLGAMFYGVFVVAMALNFAAIADMLDEAHTRACLGISKLRRSIFLELRIALVAVVSLLFTSDMLGGKVILATRLDQNSIQDIRTATERVWFLLKHNAAWATSKSLDHSAHTTTVGFSSPYPVTSSAIELYAVQANISLEAHGEYFDRTLAEAVEHLRKFNFAIVTSSMPHNLPGPRMGDDIILRLDADPTMCLVDSLPLLAARVIRIYRHDANGCGSPGSGSK